MNGDVDGVDSVLVDAVGGQETDSEDEHGRDTDEEGGVVRGMSCAAAGLFFVGLGAVLGAVAMAVVFFWPWLEGAVRWMGWVVGHHPGLVMVVLIGVAVGALRLSRWMDEEKQGGGGAGEQG